MKKIIFVCLALWMVPFSQMAQNDKEEEPHELVKFQYGFGKAKQYLEFSKDEQKAYSEGFINGALVYQLFEYWRKRGKPVDECFSGMDDEQMAAIIKKYIESHPEKWHQPLNIGTFEAIADLCQLKP
jgi:hypothetical protein